MAGRSWFPSEGVEVEIADVDESFGEYRRKACDMKVLRRFTLRDDNLEFVNKGWDIGMLV